MNKAFTLWMIDNITKWWVIIPLIIVSMTLTGSNIILLPVVGTLLAIAIGAFWALNVLSTAPVKSGDVK